MLEFNAHCFRFASLAERWLLIQRGFLILPGFLSLIQVNQLTDEVMRLSSLRRNMGLTRCSDDGDVLVMTNIDRDSDFIFDFARQPPLLEMAHYLMQSDVVPVNVEFFGKPPHSDYVIPPHQDSAFCEHFQTNMALTFWIALDDSTKESGALEYAECTSAQLLPHRPSEVGYFRYEICDQNNLLFTAVEIKIGGCLVHHNFAVHRSGPNKTGRNRRAIAFSYRASATRAWQNDFTAEYTGRAMLNYTSFSSD